MPPTLVLHGGAGVWPEDLREEAAAAIERCADAGWSLMDEGALQAVVAAVRALEDEPLFNSGIGACLTSAGTIEHDAGLMEGARLAAGAVASVLGPRHPIELARAVMESTPNVLLVGPGAVEFGRRVGVEMVDPAVFFTARRRAGLITSDTVGAVAMDATGHVAVAVSTGGYSGKLPGRVGDSPIPGAGFYAENAVGAVCATGTGEGFLRLVLSRQVRDLMASGTSAQEAVERALAQLGKRMEMTGGMIAVDGRGRIGVASTTPYMPVAIRGGAR
ncbi:MAG TPA: isoaspartyl peptidase/L-asparaginase family protein [Candidatus Dormibacteraeota bacterium]|nr:isoaspartyl peptidase/L-asparaginase family protein [Candidatus Dormibacteraeota bacterium]